MSRDDLLKINAKVMTDVGSAIKKHAPGAFVIAVTNPLDAMVTQLKRVTGFAKNRIVGQAGVLDSARYRTFLAAELGVSVESVSAMVLGGHGDDMVPIRSYTTVGGQPIERLIAAKRLEEIEKRTRGGGGEIVELMKTSSYYAAGTAVYKMVEAYMLDRKTGAAVRRVPGRRVRREGIVCGSAGRDRRGRRRARRRDSADSRPRRRPSTARSGTCANWSRRWTKLSRPETEARDSGKTYG